MLQFRSFLAEDMAFAIRLTDKEGWYLTEYDLSYYLKAPGIGVVALESGERIGLATASIFGKSAWIGNVVVDERRRQGGIGRELVGDLITRLEESGTETLLLYAYDRSKSLYERIGFEFDAVIREITTHRPQVKQVHPFTQGMSEEVIDYDSDFFRQSRGATLRHFSKRAGCVVLSSRNGKCDVKGYLVCTPVDSSYGSEIAPLIAEKEEAVELLASLSDAPTPFHLYIPEQNIPLLTRQGLETTIIRRVHRGFRGKKEHVPLIDEHVFSVGFLETG